MDNMINSSEIPMGFGMALAQNLPAMERFSHLPPALQHEIIEHTHQIRSKEEMRQYVDSLFQP